MEHPMPVGKTFPTNPSIPQKEARSFSIKDEKTPIILFPDEMSPAGKADYDSAKNNQDRANRQSDRPTGNVRHQTFFPHSRKPEQKEKVFLSSPEKNKTVVCENTPEENGRRSSLTGRPKTADKALQTQKRSVTLNSRANRSVSSLSAAYTDNSTDADIKQTVTSRNQDQNDAAKPHTGLMNDDGDGLPTKEFTREKPMIMLATVIVQLLFVCGWGFFYYFLYQMYTVIIIPGQTYQGNIYAYTIFATALTVVYSYFFYKFGQMIFAAESRIKPRIIARSSPSCCLRQFTNCRI